MDCIKNFTQLVDVFQKQKIKKRIAFICPDDEATLSVVEKCAELSLADIILINCIESLDEKLAEAFPMATIFTVNDRDEAARLGVKLVREGRADVIMKGNINTDNLLRAVLNKQDGLLPQGRVLTHVTAAEIPGFNRLILFSDAAVIPRPNLEQFEAMISYDCVLDMKLGIKIPKVALIHFTEKVNPKFQHTIDYTELIKLAEVGKFGSIEIGGPMDVKTAFDSHSASVKGIKSGVAGHADILIFPNLEAANTFYKTISAFAGAELAGMIHGTIAPVVIPSRADSSDSKFYSLALACLA